MARVRDKNNQVCQGHLQPFYLSTDKSENGLIIDKG